MFWACSWFTKRFLLWMYTGCQQITYLTSIGNMYSSSMQWGLSSYFWQPHQQQVTRWYKAEVTWKDVWLVKASFGLDRCNWRTSLYKKSKKTKSVTLDMNCDRRNATDVSWLGQLMGTRKILHSGFFPQKAFFLQRCFRKGKCDVKFCPKHGSELPA